MSNDNAVIPDGNTCILFDVGVNTILVGDVVERALIKTLGEGFKSAPWNCVVVPENFDAGIGHYWLLKTTEDEWEKLQKAIVAEFEVDSGWAEVPVECYHLNLDV